MHSPDMDEQVELVVGCITAEITLVIFPCFTVKIFHMAIISPLKSEVLVASNTFVLLESPLILWNVTLSFLQVVFEMSDQSITERTRFRF